MTLATVAIAVSMLSLAVAVISAKAALAGARASERQADDAHRVRVLEEQRRHEERAPVLKPEIETVNGQWQRLWIDVVSREDVDALTVTIEKTPRVRFLGNQLPVDGSADTYTATLTGLRAGARETALRIEAEDGRAYEVALRLESRIGDETWTTIKRVQLPSLDGQSH